MTPWLNFWTTPLISSNAKGETVIVCTVNGFKSVTLKAHLTLEEVSDYCAVLQLADALGSSPLPTPGIPAFTPTPFQQNTIYTSYVYRVPHLSLYSSRAPPVYL
ncbi:hypothetical protein [Leucothrix pacifica]|uniref:Uncharacterized protein n=1 Tax=Leucothrix pacifica TaxID=1247513 RepID=A0A317CJ60_9GAMM|nr:hypothetical protein [Leucothrix pacifica]PWQ98594.1 hypothetical protein DKW60_07595 [Leucothrix pacifica]